MLEESENAPSRFPNIVKEKKKEAIVSEINIYLFGADRVEILFFCAYSPVHDSSCSKKSIGPCSHFRGNMVLRFRYEQYRTSSRV